MTVDLSKLKWVKHPDAHHESALDRRGILYLCQSDGWRRFDQEWQEADGIDAAKAAAQAHCDAQTTNGPVALPPYDAEEVSA